MVTEITGQLIGGPDDGNLVTASVETIPIIDTIDLWLDGPGKMPSRIRTTGVYIWQADKNYFMWQLVGSEILTEQHEVIMQ